MNTYRYRQPDEFNLKNHPNPVILTEQHLDKLRKESGQLGPRNEGGSGSGTPTSGNPYPSRPTTMSPTLALMGPEDLEQALIERDNKQAEKALREETQRNEQYSEIQKTTRYLDEDINEVNNIAAELESTSRQ